MEVKHVARSADVITQRLKSVIYAGTSLKTARPEAKKTIWQKASRHELNEAARFGPGNNDDKEAIVLNRVVRWTPQAS